MHSMTKLRWALLGTARINRAVIPVLQSSERHTLVAVASRDIERARTYATEWNIPRALAPYDSLIADPDVDAIYISLPNSLHVDWTIRALEAGKHVLCEKPLALRPADVDRIASAAERAGRVAAEAFMYRHHPLTHTVERLAHDGTIGTLRVIRGAFSFNLHRENDIRFLRELGGGALWDVGCYPVSYACMIVGEAPVDVFGWEELSPSGVDVAFVGQMRFRNGVVAQFDCGFRAAFRAEMELVGTEASLRIDRAFKAGPQSRLLLSRGDDTTDVPFEADSSYVGEIDDFAAAALEGRPPRVPLSESHRTVSTICALYRSARHGSSRIDLSDP
jgi:predicted dehydrogenase